MKSIIFLLAILILFTAAFMARSEWWIVPDINRWQAGILGDRQYFPVLTAFILALPPLLILAIIKLLLDKSGKSH